MNSSRREFLDDLLNFMGELDDADARDIAERLMIRVLQRIWLKHTWADHISPDPWQITTVANTRTYALPDHFGRPMPSGVMRNLTNGAKLRIITKNDLEEMHPEAGTTFESAGQPQYFFVGGTQCVAAQPASTGQALEVVSSSAADTSVDVTIIGEDANGVEQRTKVTLLGQTPVACGTWRKITTFGKAYQAGIDPSTEYTSSAGTVTLRKISDASTIEQLLSDESSRERLVVTLYRVPDSVYTLALPFIRAPRRPIYDSDPLPRFWGPAMFEEARLEYALNRGEIGFAEFAAAPRPAFKELVEFDNALTYSGMRTDPFAG